MSRMISDKWFQWNASQMTCHRVLLQPGFNDNAPTNEVRPCTDVFIQCHAVFFPRWNSSDKLSLQGNLSVIRSRSSTIGLLSTLSSWVDSKWFSLKSVLQPNTYFFDAVFHGSLASFHCNHAIFNDVQPEKLELFCSWFHANYINITTYLSGWAP